MAVSLSIIKADVKWNRMNNPLWISMTSADRSHFRDHRKAIRISPRRPLPTSHLPCAFVN